MKILLYISEPVKISSSRIELILASQIIPSELPEGPRPNRPESHELAESLLPRHSYSYSPFTRVA